MVMPNIEYDAKTSFFSLFLSVVYVVRNQEHHLKDIINNASRELSSLVADYELIIVDNASDDESIFTLKELIGQSGFPNLQIYVLTKEVDSDTASWVGLENALGDFVAVIDPLLEDISFLPKLLDKSASGADVVFAYNQYKPSQSFAYRVAYLIFNYLYKYFNGIDLAKEAPQYRLLSKQVINFILRHPQPALTYRHMPATGGFVRANMQYCAKPLTKKSKKLWDSIFRGVRLLVSSTQMPMRIVTAISLFGAAANLIYSLYVVGIGLFKTNVAPGWVSLSLQQSGMFFLISLVLLVLGEYILHMASLSNEGPSYHVAQEFTSARITRQEKWNIEDISKNDISSALDQNIK